MRPLSHTVKNFLAQSTENMVLWALDAPFPIHRAIKKGDNHKVEKIAKKMKAYEFRLYVHEAAEYGNIAALKIMLELFECRFPQEFKSYTTNDPLKYAVENGHTDCALLLLDGSKAETESRYEAFDKAFENGMHTFLVSFIKQIPARSNRWAHVLNKLANPASEELLLLALKHCKAPGVYGELESKALQYIENLVARQQKNMIEDQLNEPYGGSKQTALQTKRKI